MRISETERMDEEIRKLCGDKPFQPFAAYFERLDRILVLVKCCSICEEKVNDILTILEDDYSGKEDDKCVGFIIECARPFCHYCGLLSPDPIQLSAILDAVVTTFPENAAIVDNIARPLLKKFSLNSVTL